mmetsp:Transcript_843/g.2581  ORF Transcript_843/g.2581 Transcript_843/m.2581 type:complete len:215 (+) Transcript_843:1989-2633(+)
MSFCREEERLKPRGIKSSISSSSSFSITQSMVSSPLTLDASASLPSSSKIVSAPKMLAGFSKNGGEACWNLILQKLPELKYCPADSLTQTTGTLISSASKLSFFHFQGAINSSVLFTRMTALAPACTIRHTLSTNPVLGPSFSRGSRLASAIFPSSCSVFSSRWSAVSGSAHIISPSASPMCPKRACMHSNSLHNSFEDPSSSEMYIFPVTPPL